MNRRQFLQTAACAAMGSLVVNGAAKAEKERAMGVHWQIGCFNRPWSPWSFDEALDGMKSAGFQQIGLLGDHKGEPLIYPEATPETLEHLKKRIEARGLKVILGRMHTRFDLPMADVVAQIHKQVDNAATLKLKYLMVIGPDKPDEYDLFYQAMAESAPYAKTHGMQVVFKPHGGVAASADEILRCLEKVNHPNFKLWYDAGNIIHYTGKDPVADVERVARYATGFCAKDCAMQHGDVMIQFGEGKVDFGGVFHKMKAAGFKGLVMIECCGGKTPSEVTEKARANRLYLEQLFATL